MFGKKNIPNLRFGVHLLQKAIKPSFQPYPIWWRLGKYKRVRLTKVYLSKQGRSKDVFRQGRNQNFATLLFHIKQT